MDITNVLIAIISSFGVIVAAWIAKQQPSAPHVERGVELIDRWDDLIQHAHDSVGAKVSNLWGFSNGKKYYDGTHAQVMNLLSSETEDETTEDFLSLQNIPIRIMLRYIRFLQPNKIAYFDEGKSSNPIARHNFDNNINTVAVFPIYDKRKFLRWFRRERLIQVMIFKFEEANHRLTPQQLNDIELISLSLSTLKIKE